MKGSNTDYLVEKSRRGGFYDFAKLTGNAEDLHNVNDDPKSDLKKRTALDGGEQ